MPNSNTHTQIGIGARVEWKATGKVARLERVAGKLITGTVTEVQPDGPEAERFGEPYAVVMADHRTQPGPFAGMETIVPLTRLHIIGTVEAR
jgi:hypothetical protein